MSRQGFAGAGAAAGAAEKVPLTPNGCTRTARFSSFVVDAGEVKVIVSAWPS